MDDPLSWTGDDQECALRAIAPWYDLDFGPLQEDVDMYLELTRPGQRVLELGAGSGRVAVPLAESGCEVTAVDSSEAMLSQSRARMRAAGVRVERADMRDLRLDERFDCVIIALSTFQHLLRRPDQLSALQVVRRQLDGGGSVILDWTAPRADDIEPTPPQMRIEWIRQATSGEMVTKSACQELAVDRLYGDGLERASPIAWITYQYDALDAAGAVRRSLARFPLRVNLNAGEMAGLLCMAGLRPIDWFGSWSFACAGEGDRLIVIAEVTGG